jgi:hypothetical protein
VQHKVVAFCCCGVQHLNLLLHVSVCSVPVCIVASKQEAAEQSWVHTISTDGGRDRILEQVLTNLTLGYALCVDV